MRAVDVLRTKRDGRELSAADIDAFVRGATDGSWPDYQIAAMLMAIYLKGMAEAETSQLTRAMAHSGSLLDWSDVPGPKIDKHSTGGVGDKTTIVLVPLAAACGLVVPKMSGRSLGHSGGTVDKLEAIPGFRVDLSLEEFRATVREIGCAIVGQNAQMALADKKIYALRDVTATVESIPLITASILSKKIPEGIEGLVLDVKCGRGAFMKTQRDAQTLARLLVRVGTDNGLKTQAVVTSMEAPLGRAVGNALEIKECLDVLRGEGPADVALLAILLTARMLLLGGLADSPSDAETRVRAALTSGQGLEKLRRMIERQGGDPHVVDDPARLPQATERVTLKAARAGFVSKIDAEIVGHASMLLGAGRSRKEDRMDPAVGVVVKARVGEQVRKGDALAEIHMNDRTHEHKALAMLANAWEIGTEWPTEAPLVLAVLDS